MLLVLLPLLLKIRYSYIEFFSPFAEEVLPVVRIVEQRKKEREEVTSVGNMQKRHVNQKARDVRLVHGCHISRALRGKTQGITSEPRARIHIISYDVVEVPDDDFRSDWCLDEEGALKERRLAEQQSGLLATRCSCFAISPSPLPLARLLSCFIVWQRDNCKII